MVIFLLILPAIIYYFIRKGQRAIAKEQAPISNNQAGFNNSALSTHNSALKTAATSFVLAWCVGPMLGKKNPGTFKLGILGIMGHNLLHEYLPKSPAAQQSPTTIDVEHEEVTDIHEQAVNGLINLGFSKKASKAAVAMVRGSTVEDLIKGALKLLKNN